MKNFTIVFFCLFSILAIGQPQQNTNIFFTKVGINPAEAGFDTGFKLSAINQNGIEYGKETIRNYFFSAEKSISKKAGLIIQHSNFKNSIVEISNTTVGLNRKIVINDKGSLSIGSSFGYSNASYDFKKYINLLTSVGVPTAMLDYYSSSKFVSSAPTSLKKNNFTLGAGLFFNNNQWSVGLSTPNVLKSEVPDITDLTKMVPLKRQLFVSVDKQSEISEKWSLKTGLMYASRFLNSDVIYLNNSIWLNKKYSVGVWYKAIGNDKSSNIPFTGVAEVVFNKMRVGYAYNFGKSNTIETDLTQQLMFRIDIDYLNKNNKSKTTETP